MGSAPNQTDMVLPFYVRVCVFSFLFILHYTVTDRLRRRMRTTTEKIIYYPLQKLIDMRFYQREGGGFYLQIMDISKWVDCYYHINVNKRIKIGEDGEHWGPFVYRPLTELVTKWFILTERPYLNDWDVIHMWLDIVDYNYTKVKRLIQPFPASIQLGFVKKPDINVSAILEMYSEGLPPLSEIVDDLSSAADRRYRELQKLIND